MFSLFDRKVFNQDTALFALRQTMLVVNAYSLYCSVWGNGDDSEVSNVQFAFDVGTQLATVAAMLTKGNVDKINTVANRLNLAKMLEVFGRMMTSSGLDYTANYQLVGMGVKHSLNLIQMYLDRTGLASSVTVEHSPEPETVAPSAPKMS